MKNKYLSKGNKEINDDKILKDMDMAKTMYEDGELLEAADVLSEIVYAIRHWKGPCD